MNKKENNFNLEYCDNIDYYYYIPIYKDVDVEKFKGTLETIIVKLCKNFDINLHIRFTYIV